MIKLFSVGILCWLTIFVITVAATASQQKFTNTSSRTNYYFNSSCTPMNYPELNNDPEAVIMVTAIEKSSHTIAVYYIKTKRDIQNKN